MFRVCARWRWIIHCESDKLHSQAMKCIWTMHWEIMFGSTSALSNSCPVHFTALGGNACRMVKKQTYSYKGIDSLRWMITSIGRKRSAKSTTHVNSKSRPASRLPRATQVPDDNGPYPGNPQTQTDNGPLHFVLHQPPSKESAKLATKKPPNDPVFGSTKARAAHPKSVWPERALSKVVSRSKISPPLCILTVKLN